MNEKSRKKAGNVEQRLEAVRSLMDEKGLPHGVPRKAGRKKALKGVRVREKVFPPGYLHGGVLLEDLHAFPGRIFRYLGGGASFEGFDPARTVFLDTETTGLSGGAGTYVFLVGIGFFDDRGFVVRQFLMPEPSEERELLARLAEDLAAFRSVVTFNGQVFDLPLLRTRYLMQRIRPAWSWEHHLDLLPVSRKLWRGKFESCRLACLEEEVLDFRRGEDIPGYAIPSLYLRFLREKRLSLLDPVMLHNRWDVASLAALAVSACRIVEGGEAMKLEGGWDFAAAGRIFAAAEIGELASACYREALNHELPEERRLAVLHALARSLKAGGRIEDAAALWRQAREEFPEDYPSRVELAKYLEHRLRDYEGALESALEAQRIVQPRRHGAAPAGKVEECRRRVSRLRGKIARSGRQDRRGRKRR